MRELVLDTETTGLEWADGHRVIEIGIVELVDRCLTGQTFHYYLCPDRDVDEQAFAVHGLSNEFLAQQPHFADIATELLTYIRDSRLIIHNAAFDIGFLNHELVLWDRQQAVKLESLCEVVDTLALARRKHPGQRNSLDALCKRYTIDNSRRTRHGALLDAEILADVYLAMTGGQVSLLFQEPSTSASVASSSEQQTLSATPRDIVPLQRPAHWPERLPVTSASGEELEHHARYLAMIQETSNGQCVWLDD
jgi:DNA polymerase-3 subunit epsilon